MTAFEHNDSEMYEAERATRWQEGLSGRQEMPGARAFGIGQRIRWWAGLSEAERAAEVMLDADRVRAQRDQREAIERSRVAARWCTCRETLRGTLCATCGWWKVLIP